MTSVSRTGRLVPGLLALGILLVLLACVAGCTQQTTTPVVTPTPTTKTVSSMPNPASVYCGDMGGSLTIETDATGGQYGMCGFPNGTTCEEWALYNGEGCKSGATPVVTTGGKKMVTFTDADNGKTSDITQGTKFAVELKENPTTGYEWNATVTNGLEIVSSECVENQHREGMVGVGSVHTWVILAKDTGSQKFSAIYLRSWEPVTGNETSFAINVNVVKA